MSRPQENGIFMDCFQKLLSLFNPVPEISDSYKELDRQIEKLLGKLNEEEEKNNSILFYKMSVETDSIHTIKSNPGYGLMDLQGQYRYIFLRNSRGNRFLFYTIREEIDSPDEEITSYISGFLNETYLIENLSRFGLSQLCEYRYPFKELVDFQLTNDRILPIPRDINSFYYPMVPKEPGEIGEGKITLNTCENKIRDIGRFKTWLKLHKIKPILANIYS